MTPAPEVPKAPAPLALVLVGGGGCGRVQAGALDALEASGLLHDVSIIVGTSVGGLNGCALAVGLAQKKGVEVLRNAWASITKNSDIYSPDLLADLGHPWLHPIDTAQEIHGFVWGAGALNTDALVRLVKDTLGAWTTDQIQAAGITLRVRAMHYERNRAETLDGDLAAMALATSAIEGLFPARFGYGDGGAVDNEPIGEALALGAGRILVVFCGPDDPQSDQDPHATVRMADPPPAPRTGLANALATLQGITQRGEALADEAAGRAEAQGVQVVYCYPKSDTGNALDFTPRDLYSVGLTCAQDAIAQAKALGW